MQAPSTLPARLCQPLLEVRTRLEALYGERLRRVILYGSQARGDARPDSDVDVLVVLEGPVEPYTEIKRMVGVETDVLDRYNMRLSLQPYDEATYQQPRHPFLSNVREEGIEL